MKCRKILMVLSLFALVSCDGVTIGSLIFNSQSQSSESTESSNKTSSQSTSNTISSSESSADGNNYKRVNRSEVNNSLREVSAQLSWTTTYTTGEQKFLVVPVQLKDGPVWTDEMLKNLETAFFGKAEDTTFESVTSFYEKSSYGKLHIGGAVTSVFKSNYTISQLNSYGDNAPRKIFPNYYNTVTSTLLKNFDVDGDGYVDNAVFIYSNDYETTADTAYWAWCHVATTDNDYLYNPNVIKPTFNSYMWASYTYMFDQYMDGYQSDKVDAHTYIHESGHMLGLDDYYSYDSSNLWDPAGQWEMQSYNIGDQNAYSKFILGWIDPYYVYGDCKINLRTSAKYGDAIIIKDNWNNSIFDEYLMIEYYTPTGLNEVDSKHRFSGRGLIYDYNGLRVYHIDARLVKLNPNTGSYLGYADSFNANDSNNLYVVGASNSYSLSYLPSAYSKVYRLIHLLDQGGFNALNGGRGGSVVSSSALWTGNKKFVPSSVFFNNGNKFNDNTKIGYSISVSNLTSESCEVVIEKN